MAWLVSNELGWLWSQLAEAADRRGDPHLLAGTTLVRIPESVAERAAATGLIGRRGLRAGAQIRVDLTQLAHKIAPLTPGAVAAHATGRRLGTRAEARAARASNEVDIRSRLVELVPSVATDTGWARLRRSGWVARLAQSSDSELLGRAAGVIALLPGPEQPAIDRRKLAADATGDPHALDTGRPVAALTLALLAASGRTEIGGTPKEIWLSVGVAYDDITGGLTIVGIAPVGWSVPHGTPVTIPPRVLASCEWPLGEGYEVFVTENPSVIGAAAAAVPGARIVCTSGTPSRVEVSALARLSDAGWQLHVRADFDDAGLNHVRCLLAAAPTARPWRMGVADYLYGLESGDSGERLRIDRLGTTPWDSELAHTMAAKGAAVYEETFLDQLVADLSSGQADGRDR